MNAHDQADAELADLLETTERTRLRALVEADIPTAERLHADDYQLITPGGTTMEGRLVARDPDPLRNATGGVRMSDYGRRHE